MRVPNIQEQNRIRTEELIDIFHIGGPDNWRDRHGNISKDSGEMDNEPIKHHKIIRANGQFNSIIIKKVLFKKSFSNTKRMNSSEEFSYSIGGIILLVLVIELKELIHVFFLIRKIILFLVQDFQKYYSKL